MNKSEAKFYNTAIKMNNALFKLLEKKSFQDISVSEICDVAGVNRSSFYSHYNNTYDLLKETHLNFMKEFSTSFEESINKIDISQIIIEDFISDKFIIPFLKFIKKNKKIYKIYTKNLNIFDTTTFYNQLLEKIWIPACKQKGLEDHTIIYYMSKYYLTGMTAVINEWVNNNCEDDILLICEIIILCVRPDYSNQTINLK